MKKLMYAMVSIVFISAAVVGCGKRTLSIDEIVDDFTNIEIADGNTGNILILDVEQTDELYNTIKEMEFNREKTSNNRTGWSYSFKFLRGSTEKAQISVISEDTLEYKGYLYKTKNGSFDLEFLKSFFDHTFEAEVIEIGDVLLVAPNLESSEAELSDKILVSITDNIVCDIDGSNININQLVVGDIIKITYNGTVLYSYPAQITSTRIDIMKRNIQTRK